MNFCKKIVFSFFVLTFSYSFSQWTVPNPMEQFCAGGSTLTFPNVGNGSGAGDMGNMGCLGSTPNPSWYFLQVANNGNLVFNISQVTNNGFPIDVDFALWGPFSSVDSAIATIQANPQGSSLIDCSYSSDNQEIANINNAQTGQIYVFLITNFDGQQGQISLTQTGGLGSTSCEFACGVSLGDDVLSCHNSHTLQADFNADNTDLTGITYQWTYNGNPLPDTTATIIATQNGEYSVTAQLTNCIQPATASVMVTLNHQVPSVQVDDIEGCAGEIYNFIEITNELKNQYPNDDFNVAYFDNFQNATANQNRLPLNYQPNQSKTIYVRITNSQFIECFSIATFDITIHQKPEITSIEDVYAICNGVPITLTVVENFDSIQWSNGNTTPTFVITQGGNYSVTVTENNCSTTKTFTVTESEKATISDVIISDFTINQNTVEIIAQGIGNYEYSINGIDYQDNNQFTDVDSGTYMIHVRDKNGCGTVTQTVLILMYPKFFTPNEDGINDYWQIKYGFTEPEMTINIFDRYGKLITSFKGKDNGWDGIRNGEKLPATDYWFYVKRENGKEHRGHFSLIR